LLGAHLVPPERRDDRAGYVRDVVDAMIAGVVERKLARAVDVYCDTGAFSLAETHTILTAARKAGLIARAHVGQFSDLGGPELLASLGATSADHLEFVSAAGIEAMASHGIVAVMLPGACVQLGQDPPPVTALRAAGVRMAVATDMNPGTTMGVTLPVQMWLATTRYGLSVEEAWLGVTKNAARAMGRHDIGVLSQNAAADVVIWDAEAPEEIPYCYDAQMAVRVIKRGRVTSTRPDRSL
jgi:imidazolonepropionase